MELKQCPFCGGGAEISYYGNMVQDGIVGFYVECAECSSAGEPFDIEGQEPYTEANAKRLASMAWNRRKGLQSPVNRAETDGTND